MTSDPSKQMTLFCLVDGESTSNAFPVEIEPTKTIGSLKDKIKLAQSPDFDDIVAKSLTLWQVLIPIAEDNDDDDEEEYDLPIHLNNIPKSDRKRLKAVANQVSEVFKTNPYEKVIHVIVQRPPPVPQQLARSPSPPFLEQETEP
ncbi:hypothetical protein BGZ76_005128, partial [Entomortierella beljakovae]